MIKFAICDDEPRMARELTERLTAYLKETGRGACTVDRFSGGSALLEGGPFDVILLDIQMGPPIVVRQGTGCQVVPPEELVYCEVQGRKLYLHRAGGGVVDCYGRLEELERRVDGRFFRCHRSYLVNLDYVRGCREGQVLLPQGEAIPVSRLRERELTQALLRRMKGGTL